MKTANRVIAGYALVAILAGASAAPVAAGLVTVDLLTPGGSTFLKGQTVPIEVCFVSTTSPDTDWASADIIFEWGAGLIFKNFVDQPIANLISHTSAKSPAQNGIIWSGANANFGGVFSADDAPGTYVTTLNLIADAVGPATIKVLAGDLGGDTVIYDGAFNDITGSKGSVGVTIQAPEPAAVMLLVSGVLLFRVRRRA